MRFPYRDSPVQPTPADPSAVVWRPIVPLLVFGLTSRVTIDGILDTGAEETILPARIINALNPAFVPGELGVLRGPDEALFPVRYGTVDLGIRLKRKLHRWHVKVAFQERRDETLLGHIGFLEHFTATFNGPERYTTLRPSGTFPMPIMPT